MKLSPEKCRSLRRHIAEIQVKLDRAKWMLSELQANDPGRGEIVVHAARLASEKVRLERRLELEGD
jgi:hypothetical protein